MANTISPNMNLIIPGVGTEAGPTYAFDVNSSLTLIDQHDHSLGNGVQITPAGLNINALLTLHSNSLTDVKSVVFTAQSSIATLQALYVKPGPESPFTEDLWFNDGNGNAVQLTSGGLVNATIASIPGESYSAGTFFWKQGASSTTPANFDIGSITLRPRTAGTTNGVVLDVPSGISSQYGIQLPLLPGAKSFLAIDSSGNITAEPAFSHGITAAMITPLTITASEIANGTITVNKLASSVLSQLQEQSFLTAGTFSFVVPVGVNFILMAGAGGGGGGGSGNSSNTANGGGGGAGSLYTAGLPAAVTPGETLTIVVGAGGTAAGGAAPGGNGFAGGNGGSSAVKRGGANIYFWYGGLGGSRGLDNTSTPFTLYQPQGGKGGTGTNGVGTAGVAYHATFGGVGGGTPAGGLGGGGGGGASGYSDGTLVGTGGLGGTGSTGGGSSGGQDGQGPGAGAGGGGAGPAISSTAVGGTGAAGVIVLSWVATN